MATQRWRLQHQASREPELSEDCDAETFPRPVRGTVSKFWSKVKRRLSNKRQNSTIDLPNLLDQPREFHEIQQNSKKSASTRLLRLLAPAIDSGFESVLGLLPNDGQRYWENSGWPAPSPRVSLQQSRRSETVKPEPKLSDVGKREPLRRAAYRTTAQASNGNHLPCILHLQ